jgi:hypothetical protein
MTRLPKLTAAQIASIDQEEAHVSEYVDILIEATRELDAVAEGVPAIVQLFTVLVTHMEPPTVAAVCASTLLRLARQQEGQ